MFSHQSLLECIRDTGASNQDFPDQVKALPASSLHSVSKKYGWRLFSPKYRHEFISMALMYRGSKRRSAGKEYFLRTDVLIIVAENSSIVKPIDFSQITCLRHQKHPALLAMGD